MQSRHAALYRKSAAVNADQHPHRDHIVFSCREKSAAQRWQVPHPIAKEPQARQIILYAHGYLAALPQAEHASGKGKRHDESHLLELQFFTRFSQNGAIREHQTHPQPAARGPALPSFRSRIPLTALVGLAARRNKTTQQHQEKANMEKVSH